MNKFKHFLNNFEYYLAAILLGLMTLLCFVQVISRYVFSYSITWAEELSVILFITSIFIGAIGGTRRNQHMRLEMVVDHFSPKTKAVLKVISNIVFILVCCVLIYAIWINIQNLFTYKMKTPILKIPKWIPYVVLPFSLCLIIFRLIQENINIIKDIKAGKYDNADEERKE
ncbi:MAG: TRAP transporter small permease [Clostridiales bacterium]|nr:TRAP transporter small permease [Clostridiales bacterium]